MRARREYCEPPQEQNVSPLALSLLGERGGGEGVELLADQVDRGCRMLEQFVVEATFEGRRGFQPTASNCTADYRLPLTAHRHPSSGIRRMNMAFGQRCLGVRIPGALPQATMSEGLRPSSRVLPVVRRYVSDVRLTGIEFDGIAKHAVPWPTAKVQRSLGQRPRYGCPHQNHFPPSPSACWGRGAGVRGKWVSTHGVELHF